MNVPDVSNLDYSELNALRGIVGERMKELRDTGISQLKATIAEQATLLGVDMKDLMPKKAVKKRKPKEPID